MTLQRSILAVGIGILLITSMGCKSSGPSKADHEALQGAYDDLKTRNEELRSESDSLREQMARGAAGDTSITSGTMSVVDPIEIAPRSEVDTFRGQLPPGANVVIRHGQPTVVIESGLLYQSGRATVNAQGKRILSGVASALKTSYSGYMIRVEGHTDTDPIRKTKHLYKDLWDLGAERSRNVVLYLISKGIDPKRIYLASFAEHHPVSSKKSKNRRVEIVVVGR